MSIITKAILVATTSVGGWLVFRGITELLGLTELVPFWSIIAGLVIILVTTKLGLLDAVR